MAGVRRLVLSCGCSLLLALSGCTSSGPGTPLSPAAPSVGAVSSPTSIALTSQAPSDTVSAHKDAPPSTRRVTAASTAPTVPPAPVAAAFARMTDAQRVGQLFMIGTPSTAVAAATVTGIRTYHVGSVILDDPSTLTIGQQKAVTDSLQADAPSNAGLFIATDQEGGKVQRMRGPGFSAIPSALVQGGDDPSALQGDAEVWGRQLRSAGINVDLAPVLDTVPSDTTGNPPIGDLDREYGHDVSTVTSHGVAVLRGLAAAGVDATIKHFPGLGRVSGNTDTTSAVTDSSTGPNDAYLRPFAAAVESGVPFVMMSTADYSRLDPGVPAAFSRRIVTGILRRELGFAGVVISDDVGNSAQVNGYSVGERAWRVIAAGGDVVLTVDPTMIAEMTAAVLARMHADPGFTNLVHASVLRVLRAKLARGLLH